MTHARSQCPQPIRRAHGLLAGFSALALAFAVVGGWGGTATAGTARAQVSPTVAKMKIIADWKAFFSSKTSPKLKIKLVQDGAAFAKVIEAQSKMPMAQGVAATVSKVTLNKALTQAKVVYTITILGKTALANQSGVAVLQGGTWKVGAQSFCALLALEGSASQVPVCKTK